MEQLRKILKLCRTSEKPLMNSVTLFWSMFFFFEAVWFGHLWLAQPVALPQQHLSNKQTKNFNACQFQNFFFQKLFFTFTVFSFRWTSKKTLCCYFKSFALKIGVDLTMFVNIFIISFFCSEILKSFWVKTKQQLFICQPITISWNSSFCFPAD